MSNAAKNFAHGGNFCSFSLDEILLVEANSAGRIGQSLTRNRLLALNERSAVFAGMPRFAGMVFATPISLAQHWSRANQIGWRENFWLAKETAGNVHQLW